MFYLSNETQMLVDTVHILYFPDEELELDRLQEYAQELKWRLEYIPAQFHTAILEDCLVSNKLLFDDYISWCEDVLAQHETKLLEIYKGRALIVEQLSESGASVFSDTLHDGELLHREQSENQVKLFFNMSGGFTPKAFIELTFLNATEQGELGTYYVYDELVKTESGFGLRVLSGGGNQYSEWTIFFEDVVANYVFKTMISVEGEHLTSWAEFVAALNPALNYYIIEKHRFVSIDPKQVVERKSGFFIGDVRLGKDFKEAMKLIYCDTYEDPYAHFSEMVSIEELEEAALSEDQTLRIRAFNTFFALGEPAAVIVNHVLRVIEVDGHERILMEITANHFNKIGCLDEDVCTRWLPN